MQKPPGGLTRRALWTLTAQSFSSGSNFLLTVFVLSTVSAQEFATFSITITAFLLIVQISRSVVSVPVLIVQSVEETSSPGAAEQEAMRKDDPSAAAAALVVGTMASGALALAALATGPFVPGALAQFLLLAAVAPLLLLQDNARHIAFARGAPAIAAISDALWVGLQLVGSVVLFTTGTASALALMAAWAAAGAMAWLFAAAYLALFPRLSGARPWMSEHRGLSRRMVVELAALSSSFYVLYFGLAIVAGTEQLGRFKAAQTMFGPVIVVLLGGISLGVPESVRARGEASHLRRIALLLSGGLAAASLVIGAAIYGLLPVFGPRWFPNAWETAKPLIPPFALFSAALGVSTGPISGLRAVGATGWITRARLAAGVVLLLVGLPASWVAGAEGALAALALVEAGVSVASWMELERILGSGAAQDPATPDAAGDP
ncbi:MAG: hypothetical protein M3179_01840 [Actinomycetota bacterium]|nr:hypothetical protein [Actinomycetota bacterium]